MLSIIVPVYNSEKYLERCLSSLVNQTLEDIEIIVIDDGSTDKSLSIIKKFAHNDSRITLLSQKNKGVSAARNVGLANTNGDFVMFVDSDDWLELDICEKGISYSKKNNSDMVLFDLKKVFLGTTITKYLFEESLIEVDIENLRKKLIIQINGDDQALLGPYCKIIRKECIRTSKFESRIFYAEDTLFVLQILQNMQKISYLKEVGYNYLQSANSISSRYLSKFNYNFIRLNRRYKVILSNKYDLYLYYVISRFFRLLVYYGIRGMDVDSFWRRWEKVKTSQNKFSYEFSNLYLIKKNHFTSIERKFLVLSKFKGGLFLVFCYYNFKQYMKRLIRYKGGRV